MFGGGIEVFAFAFAFAAAIAATAAFVDILNEDLANPVGDNLQITEEDYNQADENDTPDEPPNVQPTYDEIRDFQSMYSHL